MMIIKEKINLGVIGCGHWGKNYIRIFSELPETSLIACCDTNKSILKNLSSRYPSLKTTDNHEDIVNDKGIDAIIVATPAMTHYKILKSALDAGKHVLAEKPLTGKVLEAEELITISEKKALTLMVSHTFLYNTAVRKMKEYLKKEIFGDIYYLYSRRTHLGLIREDVSTIWDLATHDISIFSYLLDSQPEKAQVIGGRYLEKTGSDVAFINLIYPRNIIGNIHVSWIDSNKVREIVVVGSKQRIVFDDLNNLEKLRIFEKGISIDKDAESFGEFQYLLRDGDIISPKIDL
ncbi:Gfo/Idh/MocA family oxidoreductase, partial [bacterium]|nr:Gfo/Idh/MocA family oxidoreductase [bacterium]